MKFTLSLIKYCEKKILKQKGKEKAVDRTNFNEVDTYHKEFLDRAKRGASWNFAHDYRWDDMATKPDSQGVLLIEKIYNNRLFWLIDLIKDCVKPFFLSKKDEKGNSLLHLAVLRNDAEAVDRLLTFFPEMYSLKNKEGVLANSLTNDKTDIMITTRLGSVWLYLSTKEEV